MDKFRVHITLALSVAALCGMYVFDSNIAYAAENLIQNSGFESETAGTPTNWIRGRWGTNTANFTYPVTSSDGSKGARVELTARTSGDAKWAHSPVSVSAGKTYTYTDSYTANVPTFITVEFRHSNGSLSWIDIGFPESSTSWQTRSYEFTVPSGVTAATVYHLINRVGVLTIDNASIVEKTTSSSNRIQNPSFATAGTGGNPQSWTRGRWGTNTATFSYPVSGRTDSAAAQVQMSSRSSGDAKWAHAPVSVSPGEVYTFSNFSKSTVPTFITVEYRHSNGSRSYEDLGSIGPTSTWAEFEQSFTVPPDVVSLVVYHVINRNGTLTVDDYSLVEVAVDPTKFDQGYVSLTFDDGYRTTYHNAIPILDAAGFKSDQFIVTGRMGEDFPGYVSADEILDMASRGHEIGAHTRTHADLTQLSSTERQSEIGGSKADLAAIGINANTFAYPFGAYNSTVQQAVQNAGFIAGRSSDGGYNEKTTNPLALRRVSVNGNTTLAEIDEHVDTAMMTQTWVIFLFHDVSESGAPFAISPAGLQNIVDYLQDRSITPITIEEGIAMMQE